MLEGTRKPQTGLAWWRGRERTRALAVRRYGAEPELGRCCFFAPDFALSLAAPWLLGECTEFTEAAAAFPQLLHRAEPSAAEFAQLHEEILGCIAAGEFAKVVPIVCEELEFAKPLSAAMFAPTMRHDYPGQISYGFDFSHEGLAGVTPELLFHVQGDLLTTMALAGTGSAAGPALLEDRKERHEHELVIAHIESELKRWGTPEISPTEERVYGLLKHLYTPIQMKLREAPDFMQLVMRLHPTAALGGWPRQPAVKWLERQKFHSRRGRFGAPFGFVENDEMLCAVAIRCLQWQGACATLAAGCGVVAGSQALSEWREVQLKRRATCKQLGFNI